MPSTQNLILSVAGFINLVMSAFILSRGVKNKVNLFFSLLAFFNFLWTITIIIGRVSNHGMFWYYGGALLAYPVALGIAVSLYFFCLNFPIRLTKINNRLTWLLLFLAVFLSIIVYIKNLFVLDYDKNILATEYTLYINKPFYILYSLYFIFVVFLALMDLLKKIKVSDVYYKKQIFVLFIALLVGLVFGVYFDLVLCYFANYRYVWFGPIFTLFMNIYVFYLITSKK